MNFEKDDFNEYGVRINNPKRNNQSSSNLNLSVVVAVTVLFSIFNFVVGYMVGKFLGTPKPSNISISEINKTNNYQEIIGIPSSKNENTKTQLSNTQEEIEIDLGEEPLIERSPEVKTANKINSKNKNLVKISSTSKNIKDSTSTENKKQNAEKEVSSNKVGKIKYFIQVSSNEKESIAQNTLSKLKSLGINGFIQETQINGKKIYRVRIGELSSYEEAIKILEKAKKINNDAFLVVSR